MGWKLEISLACGDYDRSRALLDGTVQAEGIELNYMLLGPEEIFWRMLKFAEFDVSELSMSNYLMECCKESPRFIAIPVFISRAFRHSIIYVNKSCRIEKVNDLKGKRIGVPEYHMTAALWLRGMLQEEYGVLPADIKWFTGGVEEKGRADRMEGYSMPENVSISEIPETETLNGMLSAGLLDALMTPRKPSCYDGEKIVRLWPDYKEVEGQYYARTGIFPIMHTIAIKREIYGKYPWVAESLYKAFKDAKDVAMEKLTGTTGMSARSVSLPWMDSEVEKTQALMGSDFWPYGVEKNRVALERMLKYSFEQGLSKRELRIEDVFAPSTLKEAKK